MENYKHKWVETTWLQLNFKKITLTVVLKVWDEGRLICNKEEADVFVQMKNNGCLDQARIKVVHIFERYLGRQQNCQVLDSLSELDMKSKGDEYIKGQRT